MKTSKLVVGIIMIVLGAFIVFQSMAAGVAGAMESSNTPSGTAGVVVALAYIASGIVYIATRKHTKMGGDIATLVLAIIAWLMGISNVGVYKDLTIWSWLILIIAVIFFVMHWMANRKANN